MPKDLSSNNQSTNKEEKIVWEEDGIIRTGCVAAYGEERIKEFTGQFLKLLEAANGKGRALVDATASGGKATTSLTGRKIYIEFGKQAIAEKIAIFGINTLQRVVASFIMKTINIGAGIKELKFFEKKEEAIKWLKED
jgi:hypothetical protein